MGRIQQLNQVIGEMKTSSIDALYMTVRQAVIDIEEMEPGIAKRNNFDYSITELELVLQDEIKNLKTPLLDAPANTSQGIQEAQEIDTSKSG